MQLDLIHCINRTWWVWTLKSMEHSALFCLNHAWSYCGNKVALNLQLIQLLWRIRHSVIFYAILSSFSQSYRWQFFNPQPVWISKALLIPLVHWNIGCCLILSKIIGSSSSIMSTLAGDHFQPEGHIPLRSHGCKSGQSNRCKFYLLTDNHTLLSNSIQTDVRHC